MPLKFKKIDRKKGNDMMAFAIILPGICFLMFAIVIISQLCLTRQTLEYAVYNSARAAVICDNYNDACIAAENTAKRELINNTFGIKPDDIECKLTLVAGTSTPPGGSFDQNNGFTWEKGALLEIDVLVHLEQAVRIAGDTMHTTMYVMVERPAAEFGS